jgi:hypothetical protein
VVEDGESAVDQLQQIKKVGDAVSHVALHSKTESQLQCGTTLWWVKGPNGPPQTGVLPSWAEVGSVFGGGKKWGRSSPHLPRDCAQFCALTTSKVGTICNTACQIKHRTDFVNIF